MSYIFLTNFEEKDVSTLIMVTFTMMCTTFAMSVVTFIMAMVIFSKPISHEHYNVTYSNVTEAEPEPEPEPEADAETEGAEEAEAEEAEAEGTVETVAPVAPMPQVPRVVLYRAAENADEIIIREHSHKTSGKQQITAIVRFLQENGPSTKQAISNAMVNLGENYSGGSSQRIRPTVSKWLYPNLHKGCISTN
jgi:hypothetical protein